MIPAVVLIDILAVVLLLVLGWGFWALYDVRERAMALSVRLEALRDEVKGVNDMLDEHAADKTVHYIGHLK